MPGKQFTEAGFFWLPENEAKRYSGVLEFDPLGGGSLTITVDSMRATQPPFRDVALVCGECPSLGGAYTLLDCRNANVHVSSRGGGKCEYRVSRILKGATIREEELRVQSVTAYYTHLQRWLCASGVRLDMDMRSIEQFDVNYQQPDPVAIATEIGLNVSLLVWVEKFPFRLDPGATFCLRETAAVEFANDEECDLEYYLEAVRSFQDFLSVACLTLAAPEKVLVELRPATGREEVGDVLELFNADALQDERDPESPPNAHWEFLFNREDAGEDLELVVNNWFRKSDDLKPSRQLYMGAVYSRTFLEPFFLALCQAVEVYHRRFFEGVYIKNKDHFDEAVLQPLLAAIPQGIESSHRDAIRARLRYSNEYSLRRRLRELFTRHESSLGRRVRNLSDYAAQIADDRNFLTHREKPHVSYEFDPQRLVAESVVLRVLLELCFMHEMGFSQRAIDQSFGKNQIYARLLPLNRR